MVVDHKRENVRAAVMVTLHLNETAGGHVKVWERFAEAAAGVDDLDLTVYFLGESETVISLSEACRLQTLPPKLGTDRFRWLDSGAGHTDLARSHPDLGKRLADRNILITTDHFAFGKTAAMLARSNNIPFAHSIHTDVQALAQTYGPRVLRNIFGEFIGRTLADTFKLGARIGESEKAKLLHHVKGCDHIFVSRPEDAALLNSVGGIGPTSMLRRGIDIEVFSPCHCDRDWLFSEYGVPQSATLVMFAGRFDKSKNAGTAIRTVRALLDKGYDLFFLVAGQGADLEQARVNLGRRLVAPGFLDQKKLARTMASADLFLFPSETETFGNVVLEARASGLPVVVSARRGGTARWVHQAGWDGLVVADGDPQSWIEVTESALGMDLGAMGRASRQRIECHAPSWETVFKEDLVRQWRGLVRSAKGRGTTL